jgi:hypothetical protein
LWVDQNFHSRVLVRQTKICSVLRAA